MNDQDLTFPFAEVNDSADRNSTFSGNEEILREGGSVRVAEDNFEEGAEQEIGTRVILNPRVLPATSFSLSPVLVEVHHR